MHYVNFALLLSLWHGLLICFNNKKTKSDIFGNIKGHVTPV